MGNGMVTVSATCNGEAMVGVPTTDMVEVLKSSEQPGLKNLPPRCLQINSPDPAVLTCALSAALLAGSYR